MIPKEEWLNIKIFLKRLANEYYDMELLSKSIMDKEKAKEALTYAQQVRTKARECDDAISAKNYDKIIEVSPTMDKLFQNFFSALNDVPDEL